MCGIVGAIDRTKTGILMGGMTTFEQLLYVDGLRGFHGTGAFGLDKDNNNYQVKIGGPPMALFATEEWKDMQKFVSWKHVRFLVGHNRYATRGGKTTAATHPFRHGNIILVHNGTLDAYKHLPDAKKFDVDSEALCYAISVDGVEKTIGSLHGAWSIVYYDLKAKTLNFLRNSERPMWFAHMKGEKDKVAFFASEPGMLEMVLGRNLFTSFKLECLPENRLLTFPLDLDGKVTETSVKGAAAKKKAAVVYADNLEWKTEDAGGTTADKKTEASPYPKLVGVPSTLPPTSGTPYLPRSNSAASLAPSRKASSAKGKFNSVKALRSLTVGGLVTVMPAEVRDVSAPGAKEGYFEFQCLVDDLPEFTFYIYHKCSLADADLLMEAPHGIRAEITNIMKSDSNLMQHPHRVFLKSPEPQFVQEPAQVPDQSALFH